MQGQATKYVARMSYSFQPAGDLTEVAQDIVLTWRSPDDQTGDERLTDSRAWKQTFTGGTFPASSGFAVRVRMKDEALLDKSEYVLAYSCTYLLEIVDEEGTVVTNISSTDTPSFRVSKENLWGTVILLNEDMQYYFRLYRDGRHERVPKSPE